MNTGSTPTEARCEWRVGHRGRDQMYYEEFLQGVWQRIEVQGEMLMGRAHHVIYFASPADGSATRHGQGIVARRLSRVS